MKLWLLVLLTLTACRGGTVDPFELANQRVAEGVTEGSAASTASGPVTLPVRYNPAPCECPPHEVFAYGHWMRAFIEGDLSAIDALQNADPLAVANIDAAVESKRRAAPNGVLYPVVVSRE